MAPGWVLEDEDIRALLLERTPEHTMLRATWARVVSSAPKVAASASGNQRALGGSEQRGRPGDHAVEKISSTCASGRHATPIEREPRARTFFQIDPSAGDPRRPHDALDQDSRLSISGEVFEAGPNELTQALLEGRRHVGADLSMDTEKPENFASKCHPMATDLARGATPFRGERAAPRRSALENNTRAARRSRAARSRSRGFGQARRSRRSRGEGPRSIMAPSRSWRSVPAMNSFRLSSSRSMAGPRSAISRSEARRGCGAAASAPASPDGAPSSRRAPRVALV